MLNQFFDSSKTYSLEISRIFGFLSILFGYVIPLTGLLMGIFGIYYEYKNSKEDGGNYNKFNLILNSIGIVYGLFMFIRWLILLNVFG